MSYRKLHKVSIVLLMYTLLFPVRATGSVNPLPLPDGWHPGKKTNAGQIYRRNVGTSPISMIMIATTFKADAARVLAVATDYDHFSEFIPNVLESRVLLHEGDDQWVFHHLRFPGPVTDRVYVIKSTVPHHNAGKDYRVEWQLARRQFPDTDLSGGIRPRTFSGYWELQRSADLEMTEARYAVHSEPGGMIPAWLVEKMTERYVQQVVEAIQKRLLLQLKHDEINFTGD